MAGKTKIFVSCVIGLLLSTIALYFTFRNIPISDLFRYLKTVNYWWAIPSVAAALFGFVIRVLRWQLLLSPFKKTGFWRAFHPLMIGFALNLIMPARVGELARPAIFCKKEKVPFSRVLATVGAERIFDILILLLFFAVVIVSVDIDPGLDLTFGDYHLNKTSLERIGINTLKVALILVAGIVFLTARRGRAMINRLVFVLPKLLFFAGKDLREKMKKTVCLKIVETVENFGVGFDMLRSPKKVGLCLVLSFVAWIFAAMSHYLFTFGSPGIDVSFLEMCAVMVILCFFISLPSVPGFWGLWEAGGVFGLLIFGVSSSEAAGFTLVNHFFQIMPILVIGLVSSVITGVSLVRLTYEKQT
jgi:glycosyltransferase 2 family protein